MVEDQSPFYAIICQCLRPVLLRTSCFWLVLYTSRKESSNWKAEWAYCMKRRHRNEVNSQGIAAKHTQVINQLHWTAQQTPWTLTATTSCTSHRDRRFCHHKNACQWSVFCRRGNESNDCNQHKEGAAREGLRASAIQMAVVAAKRKFGYVRPNVT